MTLSWLPLQSALNRLLDQWHAISGSAERDAADLLLAVAVALVFWGVAVLVRLAVKAVLVRARFGDAARRLVATGAFGAVDPSRLVAWSVHWVIVTAGIVLALDVLGFGLSESLGERLRDVLPRVLTAAILLLAGVVAAAVLGGVTERFFQTTGLPGARWRGQAVGALFTFVAVLLALEQLGFAAQFVMGIGLVLAGAAGLGLAFAFGFGCRELARDFLVEYLRSLEDDRPGRP